MGLARSDDLAEAETGVMMPNLELGAPALIQVSAGFPGACTGWLAESGASALTLMSAAFFGAGT